MPVRKKPDAATLVLVSATPAATCHLGERLGAFLRAGDILLLEGDLGVGKTLLTQGLGAGLGVRGQINSPTFTLLKEYAGRLPLYHFDFYRIESPGELDALGFEEYFGGDGVAVVEWADRAGEVGEHAPWPEDYLRIRLRTLGPERRELLASARGARGTALLHALASLGADAPPAAPEMPETREAFS